MYWNTVNPLLHDTLLKLMGAEVFFDFRLVGGTALSLHLGHRMSVDIDLFTDADYGKVNFDNIGYYLKETFAYVDSGNNVLPGMGKSYFVGNSESELVKLDVYYSNEKFIQDFEFIEGVRIATVDEIVAMKVDVVSRIGRKKDFWDLHEVLPDYPISKMLSLHKDRHEWTHFENEILSNFTNFDSADSDFDPICLKGKHWEFIKDDFAYVIKKYISSI